MTIVLVAYVYIIHIILTLHYSPYIIHDDLHLNRLNKRHAKELTAANCMAGFTRSKQLLHKFSSAEVDFYLLH